MSATSLHCNEIANCSATIGQICFTGGTLPPLKTSIHLFLHLRLLILLLSKLSIISYFYYHDFLFLGLFFVSWC